MAGPCEDRGPFDGAGASAHGSGRPPAGPSYGDVLAKVRQALGRTCRDGAPIDAGRDARLLTAHAAGMAPAAFLSALPDRAPEGLAERALALAARRRAGESPARILGRRGFWTLDLELSPDTLEPRPETETVVEAVLERMAAAGLRGRPVRILDIGTGTGALLLALLAECPLATGVGTDIAPGAAAMAHRNAALNGLGDRAAFLACDLASAISRPFDVVVSNPPYVSEEEWRQLPAIVRSYDPPRSLLAGSDGLAIYRRILVSARALVVPGGLIGLEIAPQRLDGVLGLGAAAGLTCVEVRSDVRRQERSVVFQLLN